MYKKLIAILLLVMIICCGCGRKKEPAYTNDLNEIVKRGVLTVGVRTDAYPFGYIDKNGS